MFTFGSSGQSTRTLRNYFPRTLMVNLHIITYYYDSVLIIASLLFFVFFFFLLLLYNNNESIRVAIYLWVFLSEWCVNGKGTGTC